MKTKNGKIGIGITTHNRNDVFRKSMYQILKFAPKDAVIVTVDDASKRPVKGATFRFSKNVGIATAKNKCIELLEGCEHIFLFDDDTYPLVKNWHVPYIESGEPHLMYLFQNFKRRRIHGTEWIYEDSKIKALNVVRGCMLYFHRSAIEKAGGMDTEYGRWGWEHGDLSNRIYNLGLTSFRYADVVGSEKLIYSGDEYESVDTTVEREERKKYIKDFSHKYEYSMTSTDYKPYRDYPKKKPRYAVMTVYFNGQADPQREHAGCWEPDFANVEALANSVSGHGIELHVLHNCFDLKDRKLVKFHRQEQGLNPYAQRWLAYWKFLRENPEIDFVFGVDATDVEMIKNPFPELAGGTLYVGDEINKVGHPWLKKNTHDRRLQEWIVANRGKTLLNCGVVGGERKLVMRLCRMMYELSVTEYPNEHTDMTLMNYLVYTHFGKVFRSGREITSEFKAFEKNPESWFRHK